MSKIALYFGRRWFWVGGLLLGNLAGLAGAAPITTEQITTVRNDPKQMPEIEQAIEQFKQQKFEAALELLNAAAKKNPELPPGRTTLARLFLQANQLAPARALIEQEVLEQPGDPEAYRMLGDIAFQERRLAEAQLLFETLASVAAKFDGNAVRKSNYESASHAGLAAVAEARQQWETAHEHLAAWLKKDPQNPGAHHRMGQALFGLNKPQDAYRELQTAAAEVAELPPPEVTMGRLYQQSGKPEVAGEWMQKAIDKSPDLLAARLGVAQWQWEVGRYEEAKQNVEAALKIQADSLDGLVLAGLINRFLKDLPAAEKHLQAAYLASPGNAIAANQLALVLADQADPAKKKRALELAEGNAREFNNNVEVAATLGWAYLQQGRNDEAARVLKAVANSGRVSPDTAYFMAVLSQKTGNGSEAIATLQAALDSRSPFAYREEAKQLLSELESQPSATGAQKKPAGDEKPTGEKPATPKPTPKAGGSTTPRATTTPPAGNESKAPAAKAGTPGKPTATTPAKAPR